MRYAMPNFRCEFEIPDDWLTEAGAVGFIPPSTAYHSSSDAILVPLVDIEPPYCSLTIIKDWRGLTGRGLFRCSRARRSAAFARPAERVRRTATPPPRRRAAI